MQSQILVFERQLIPKSSPRFTLLDAPPFPSTLPTSEQVSLLLHELLCHLHTAAQPGHRPHPATPASSDKSRPSSSSSTGTFPAPAKTPTTTIYALSLPTQRKPSTSSAPLAPYHSSLPFFVQAPYSFQLREASSLRTFCRCYP